MSANIDLTAFSEMIFGDSRVKFWSEIRCIPWIFYNRVTTSVDIHVFSPTKRPIPVERPFIMRADLSKKVHINVNCKMKNITNSAEKKIWIFELALTASLVPNSWFIRRKPGNKENPQKSIDISVQCLFRGSTQITWLILQEIWQDKFTYRGKR